MKLKLWQVDAFAPKVLEGNPVAFETRSGTLVVNRGRDGQHVMSLPTDSLLHAGQGVPEDPVTGSAHCALTPYWSKRLGKKALRARQVSPRGGDLICSDEGARTVLSGQCALYMTAEISV